MRRGNATRQPHFPDGAISTQGRVACVRVRSRRPCRQWILPLASRYASYFPSRNALQPPSPKMASPPLDASRSYTDGGDADGQVSTVVCKPTVCTQSQSESRDGTGFPSALAFASATSHVRIVLPVSPCRHSLVLPSLSTSTSLPRLFIWLNVATSSDGRTNAHACRHGCHHADSWWYGRGGE